MQRRLPKFQNHLKRLTVEAGEPVTDENMISHLKENVSKEDEEEDEDEKYDEVRQKNKESQKI